MELGLHAGCIMNTNVVTDIRIAQETGYDAIELWITKLRRYLDNGFPAEELVPKLGNLSVTMLNCVLHVEKQDPGFRKELIADFERLCHAAEKLNCGALQMIVLDSLKGMKWPEQRRLIAASLAELADIAKQHGLKLAVEPVVFSPFNTIRQFLEVHEEAGRDNISIVVDTWHIWTAGVPWEDVAALDSGLIHGAHLSDTNPMQGDAWHDDDRTALPGDGVLPLVEGIQAVMATGYEGTWSVEMLSHEHWEWDPEILARELKERSKKLLREAGCRI